MNTINTDDIYALIALAVKNKPSLIQAMNSSGYSVSQDISDDDLFNEVKSIYMSKGVNSLNDVLGKVKFDKSKYTQAQADNIAKYYANPNFKCGFANLSDCFTGIGDFLGGHSTVSTPPSVVTSKPLISSTTVIAVAVIIIIIIILLAVFKKVETKTAIYSGIAVLALLILYGIFAKTITQTSGGNSTDTHAGALSWLDGILNGLHLSVAGL